MYRRTVKHFAEKFINKQQKTYTNYFFLLTYIIIKLFRCNSNINHTINISTNIILKEGLK